MIGAMALQEEVYIIISDVVDQYLFLFINGLLGMLRKFRLSLDQSLSVNVSQIFYIKNLASPRPCL